jgi:hypothetical protein
MGKIIKRSSNEYDTTTIRMLVAFFFGACAVLTVESIAGDAKDEGWQLMDRVPAWQVHMGSACLGIMTFVVALFILEVFETRSKTTAWRSSSPWLPLIALTAMATGIHIIFYVVIPIGCIYGIWAYRKTCSVHRVYVSSVSSKRRM